MDPELKVFIRLRVHFQNVSIVVRGLSVIRPLGYVNNLLHIRQCVNCKSTDEQEFWQDSLNQLNTNLNDFSSNDRSISIITSPYAFLVILERSTISQAAGFQSQLQIKIILIFKYF